MSTHFVSANIRFENPADKDNNWPHRKAFLTELISSKNPMILGTQEGREPQLRELESLLPTLTMIDGHRTWIEERMYPCLFINSKAIEVINSGDIWLSETPDIAGSKSFSSAFPRLCVWASLKIKSTEKEFLAINCHLDHVKEETRVEQVKVLACEIKKVNKENKPIMLMGDFNSSPDGVVRSHLISHLPLLDPWQMAGKKERTSFHKFDGISPDGSESRIDWILFSEQFRGLEIEMLDQHSNGQYPSDHFFMYAKADL